MRHSPERAARILTEAARIMQNNEPDDLKLRRLWATLAYIKSFELASTLAGVLGAKVYSGPFKGMELTLDARTGAFAPALLGTYELELQPAFEQLIAQPYRHVLNIGCAFGYYAVGLARRMPQAAVHAFDIKESEQQRCRDMAALNNVADRVAVAGLFKGEDFAHYADEKTLVVMDIEGGEMDLLDPARYPALHKMDIVVELHDVFDAAISGAVRARFAATHDIEIIPNRAELFDFTPITGPQPYIDPFDRLLATWENRDGPTPWAVMRVKQ